VIRVTFVAHDGTVREVAGEAGQSLMALAVATGTPGIDGDCGGAMACGTCHVLIAPEWRERVGAPCEFEESLLSVTLDPGPGSRLGCQVALSEALDGLVVHTPESQKA
jgi:2Fe-2S ferredoxin